MPTPKKTDQAQAVQDQVNAANQAVEQAAANEQAHQAKTRAQFQLNREKWYQRLTRGAIISFIGTLIYSAVLWSFITLATVSQVILETICFKIFAGFAITNAVLATANAWVSPDQKTSKTIDAVSAVVRGVLISLAVFGGAIFAPIVIPSLFIAALCIWIIHDAINAAYHYRAYRKLHASGLQGTPEAQMHLATAKISLFSSILGLSTLVGTIAFMGTLLGAMTAFAANPVTGPIIWACSAAFAIYLTVQFIGNTEWGKNWAHNHPTTVKYWRKITTPIRALGNFVKTKFAKVGDSIKKQAAKSGLAQISSPITDSSTTITLNNQQQTTPNNQPSGPAHAPPAAAPLTQDQKDTLKKVSIFYAEHRADQVRKLSASEGYEFLVKEIDNKISQLENDAINRQKAGFWKTFITPKNLQKDKIQFLNAAKEFMHQIETKGKNNSNNLKQDFEDFISAQKTSSSLFERAANSSDVKDIREGIQAWVDKIDEEQTQNQQMVHSAG